MSAPAENPRRHDLDALRAFAMLLGIGLHAGLSFAPVPWPVQDSQQNGVFYLFFSAIHGFRMPLFFLLSGFFTAMLWRRRGLRATIWHRVRRILLPLTLSVFTIAPLVHFTGKWVIQRQAVAAKAAAPAEAAATDATPLIAAIQAGDRDTALGAIAEGADPNARDAKIWVPALAWASMRGDTEVVDALIEAGANVNARNGDGATALHGAAFFGHAGVAEALLEAGADAAAVNDNGETPFDSAQIDPNAVGLVAGMLGVPASEPDEVAAGRARIVELLADGDADRAEIAVPGDWRDAYFNAIDSPKLTIRAPWSDEGQMHLVDSFAFQHLWFLWHLCWLLVAFAAYAWAIDRTGWRGPPRWLVRTPAHWLLLLPATLFFQAFMHVGRPGFGPDTSAGLLPAPHVLGYYAVFYFFGVLYFDADDADGRLGRRWWLWLLVSFVVLMPISLAAEAFELPAIGPVFEVMYAWLVSFGLIGLCRTWLSGESRAIRYVSDSSYWLYLIHLPLVYVGQLMIRDWRMLSFVKFAVLCAALTIVLLLSYQLFVRYTWIGWLLNGPRKRPRGEAAEVQPAGATVAS